MKSRPDGICCSSFSGFFCFPHSLSISISLSLVSSFLFLCFPGRKKLWQKILPKSSALFAMVVWPWAQSWNMQENHILILNFETMEPSIQSAYLAETHGECYRHENLTYSERILKFLQFNLIHSIWKSDVPKKLSAHRATLCG